MAKVRPRKILQVVHGFLPECRGGTEHYVLEASLALKERGHDVSVLAGSLSPRPEPVIVEETVEGLRVARLHRAGLFIDDWHKSQDPRVTRLFAEYLAATRPDVVHVHHWIRLTRDLVATAVSAGIPAVVTLHDAMTSCPRAFRVRDETLCNRDLSIASCLDCVPRPRWMGDAETGVEIEAFRDDLRRELELARTIIVPTLAQRAFLAPRLGLRAARLTVAPHGRLERHRPHPAERVPSERIRLGHWGHLDPIKGFHLLLEALRGLPPPVRDRFEVVCWGEATTPAYRRRLDELASGLAMDWRGAFRPESLSEAAIDLAVIPSIASESYSFVLDEAFELGVPALVPDRGALAERIGAAGTTFAPESADALADRLREIAADPGVLARWADAIPALLPMAKHAKRLESIYARAGEPIAVAAPAPAPDPLVGLSARLERRTAELEQALGRAEAERARADGLKRAFDDAMVSVGNLRALLSRKEADLAGFERSVNELRAAAEARAKDVASYAASTEELRAALGRKETDIAGFDLSVRQLRAQLAEREADLQGFRRSVEQLQAALLRKDEDIRAFEVSTEQLRAELARKETDLQGFQESVVQLRAALDRSEANVLQFQQSVDGLLAALARKDADLLGFQQSVAAHQASLVAKDHDLARWESAVVELRTTLAAREAVIAALESSATQHEAAIRQLEATLVARDATIGAFQTSVSQHRALVAARDATIAAFEGSVVDLRREIERWQTDAEATGRSQQAAQAQWDATLREFERSVELHRGELATARAEVEARTKDFARVDAECRRVTADWREAVVALRASEVDLAASCRLAAEADAARTAAERHARGLVAAMAEERAVAEKWRRRSVDAERALATARAEIAERDAALVRAATEVAAARADAARWSDDATRLADQIGRIEGLLGLPPAEGSEPLSNRTAAAAGRIEDLTRSLALARDDLSGRPDLRDVLDATPRRLRILLVIHDFLPYHAAGSEIYTYQLAKALQTRHDVHLVFCENRPERPQFETQEGVFDGLPFTEIVHHDAFHAFSATYLDARMEVIFEGLLDRLKPDVVHLQHTKFFGVGIIGRARRRGIVVVFTLHEYMLLCARDGIMRRPDNERCLEAIPAKCVDCIEHRLIDETLVARATRGAGRLLSKVLPARWRSLGARIERRASSTFARPASRERRLLAINERQKTIFEALREVDLFLAPSNFLREAFIRSGAVPAERIQLSRYGQDLTRFGSIARVPSELLRVGYLGTIAEYKGLNVLIDALNGLAAFPVEGRIHGALEIFPEFVGELRRRSTNPRVRFLGRFDNRDVARLLAGIDVLVVPSLWWENSPLTIHEAFLAEVPVVTSDQGGMAELVQDGVNGFHFRIGDALDLGRVLLRLVTDRSLIEKLRPQRSTIRDIREDALWTASQYRRLIAERRVGPRR